MTTGPRYGSYRSSSSQPDASSSRLTIDLLPSTTDLAGAAAAAAPPPVAPPPVDLRATIPPTPATGVRTIVIDPGHGGDELGAQGPRGTLEKEITLAVSRRLRTLIESRLGMRVFLTREDDRTISHDDRSAFANNHQADVFLSIHANAAVRPHIKGAEVYYLSVERADAEARKRAEDAAVALPALGGGTRAIDLILWETAQSRYLEQSAALAAAVEESLRARVEMSPRAVQQAPFRVLVGANMPAALVEIGYVSNPEQEQQLTSADYQDQGGRGAPRRHRQVPRAVGTHGSVMLRRVLVGSRHRGGRRRLRLAGDVGARPRPPHARGRAAGRGGGSAGRGPAHRERAGGGPADQGHAVLRLRGRPPPGRRGAGRPARRRHGRAGAGAGRRRSSPPRRRRRSSAPFPKARRCAASTCRTSRRCSWISMRRSASSTRAAPCRSC